jgi:hypothetical protein
LYSISARDIGASLVKQQPYTDGSEGTTKVTADAGTKRDVKGARAEIQRSVRGRERGSSATGVCTTRRASSDNNQWRAGTTAGGEREERSRGGRRILAGMVE